MMEEPFRVEPFIKPHSDSARDRRWRYSRVQPQCEICWMRDNPEKVPELGARSAERCSSCGTWHRSGIFIDADPEVVPYPSILIDGGRERF